MLWFDNSETPLSVKIRKATDYYYKKYGVMPNSCLVHPSTLKDTEPKDFPFEVRSYLPVLPGHIWIGLKESNG